MAKPKLVEEAFHVPSLAEADAEYGKLVDRYNQVSIELGTNRREQAKLETDLKQKPAVNSVRAGLADLIGDAVEVDNRPAKLAELRKRERDLEEAMSILSQRQRDRKGPASARVCEAVRAEFGSRVKALATALEAAHAARLQFENLIDDLEAGDVTWQSRLVVDRPRWMGDREDGHVSRFLKAAKEQKYV